MTIPGPRCFRSTKIGNSKAFAFRKIRECFFFSHFEGRFHELIPGPRSFRRRFDG